MIRVCVDVPVLCHLGSMEELKLVVCMLESFPPCSECRRVGPTLHQLQHLGDVTQPFAWAK